MKAQKLGLVLGINMAAACLMMQGCKNPDAVKPGRPYVSQPPQDKVIIVSRPAPRPAAVPERVLPPQSAPTAVAVRPVPPPPPLPPPVQPVVNQPSAVRTIKPLPAPASKAPTAKPASAPAPVAAPAATTTEYVVKPGDTLFLISKRTNYRQDAIVAANPGLTPKLIPGQKIKMPGAIAAPAVAKTNAKAAKGKDGKILQAAAPSPAAANTKPPVKTKNGFAAYEGSTKDYVVKSRDTLGKIAFEYGISVPALKALNGLQKDSLRVGQKLKVPTEKQSASAKTLPAAAPAAGKKDSAVKEAAAPAAAAKGTAEVKKEAVAPAPAPAETAPAAEIAKSPAVEESSSATTYTVKDGDDLVSVAISYGVSPSVLMDLNDLKASDEIKPGQVLKLPANAKAQ